MCFLMTTESQDLHLVLHSKDGTLGRAVPQSLPWGFGVPSHQRKECCLLVIHFQNPMLVSHPRINPGKPCLTSQTRLAGKAAGIIMLWLRHMAEAGCAQWFSLPTQQQLCQVKLVHHSTALSPLTPKILYIKYCNIVFEGKHSLLGIFHLLWL